MQTKKSIADYVKAEISEFAGNPLRHSIDVAANTLKEYGDMAILLGAGYLRRKSEMPIDDKGVVLLIFAGVGYSFLPFVDKGGKSLARGLRNSFSVLAGAYSGFENDLGTYSNEILFGFALYFEALRRSSLMKNREP